jgi:hypothetical protein
MGPKNAKENENGGKYIMESYMICSSVYCCYDIMEVDRGRRTFSTYKGNEKLIQDFIPKM